MGFALGFGWMELLQISCLDNLAIVSYSEFNHPDDGSLRADVPQHVFRATGKCLASGRTRGASLFENRASIPCARPVIPAKAGIQNSAALLSESGFTGFVGFSGFRFAQIAFSAISQNPANPNANKPSPIADAPAVRILKIQ